MKNKMFEVVDDCLGSVNQNVNISNIRNIVDHSYLYN